MKRMLASLAFLAALSAPAWAQEAISYPDPSLTPGAIRSTDASEICATGTSQFRHWDRDRSDLIFERYHIARADRIAYTLDHLIPLAIGGADTIENIWPQPRRSLAGEWDDTRKDQLEHRLAILVCSGELNVLEAQQAIADDWPTAFVKFVSEPRQWTDEAIPGAVERRAAELGCRVFEDEYDDPESRGPYVLRTAAQGSWYDAGPAPCRSPGLSTLSIAMKESSRASRPRGPASARRGPMRTKMPASPSCSGECRPGRTGKASGAFIRAGANQNDRLQRPAPQRGSGSIGVD